MADKVGDYRIVSRKGFWSSYYVVQQFKRNEAYQTILVYDWEDVCVRHSMKAADLEIQVLTHVSTDTIVRTY